MICGPKTAAEGCDGVSLDWQEHVDEIEERGFTIVPDVVSGSEVETLRQEVLDALEHDWNECGGMPGKAEFIVLELIHHSPAAANLLENETMHRVFSHFLGDTCILYSATSTILRPHEKHYTCEIHTDTPRLVPEYHLSLLMTLALDDFTEENGATWYLPGSHRSPDKPSEQDFYANAVRVCRKAGDAAFFHPRVWHAGGSNDTNETRVGCTLYACRSWMRQRFDYPRMLDERTVGALGETGRRFLGFNVRVPTSMDEFYRKPEDRLYKPNQG